MLQMHSYFDDDEPYVCFHPIALCMPAVLHQETAKQKKNTVTFFFRTKYRQDLLEENLDQEHH